MATNKITYEDKVKVQDLDLPLRNTFTDGDANEIKRVVNEIESRITNIETNNTTPISVSAIWDSGLKFNVRADSFPVSGEYFSATAADVTLDTADPTNPRFDLIVANKPIAPNTVGSVGFVKGTPSVNPSEPDYDPDLQYVIKLVLIEAGATLPKDQSGKEVNRELVFDEGVGEPTEWTYSITANGVLSTNDSYSGSNSIEFTNPTWSDKLTLTNATKLNTSNLDVLTFWIKQKESFGTSYVFVKFFNGTIQVGESYLFNTVGNVFDEMNFDWQQVRIDKSKLNLPNSEYDKIEIFVFKNGYSGYFIDLLEVHTGSSSGVQEPTVESENIYNTDGSIPTGVNRVVSVGTNGSFEIATDNFDSDFWMFNYTMQIGSKDLTLYSIDNKSQLSFIDGSPLEMYARNGFKLRLGSSGTPTPPTIGQVLSASSTTGDLEWGIQSAHIQSTTAPTPTSTGTKGQVIINGGYRYECIATNTWTRTAIETTW